MFSKDKRRYCKDTTVKEVFDYLMQNNLADAKLTILGDPWFYIHVEEDRSEVSLDDSSLSDLECYGTDDVKEL